MTYKKIRLSYGKNRFDLNLKVCDSFEKFSGLMFTRREKARALLFDFKKPTKNAIHSWFVFFDFIAIWLDENGKIIKFEVVKPFRFLVRPARNYSKLIEIPMNGKYSRIVETLVGS